MIRQPIVSVLGHVDHGKTTLLDCIRKSVVAKGEAGKITQHIGVSEVPIDVIKRLCGPLLRKMKVEVSIPGLLFIDTPGHAAFSALRKRGGSIADIAILIVDINEGMKPQTLESIEFLKQFRTPFIVAATKIDLLPGWNPSKGMPFAESLSKQADHVRTDIENKVYTLVGELSEKGFDCERFDRIGDFSKQIAIVPCSGATGEGIPDLLMMLTGLAQHFLKGRLEMTEGIGKGAILEVKEAKGLGKTMDAILYDGSISVGDIIVIGAKEPVVSKVKALLKPAPLGDIRAEKKFDSFSKVSATSGVKISIPSEAFSDSIISGLQIRAVRTQEEAEKAKEELEKDVESIEIHREGEGVALKADTIGSLEALIRMTKELGVPIRKAEIGPVNKSDVHEQDVVKDRYKRVFLCFNVRPVPESAEIAGNLKIKIFSSDVIYSIFDEFREWMESEKEKEKKEILAKLVRPGEIKIMPGCVFRSSRPAVFGVEVLRGIIKPGYHLMKDGKSLGIIRQLQKAAENVSEAKIGQEVAVSVDDMVIGKHADENDILVTDFKKNQEQLRGLEEKLSDSEKELLGE